MNGRWLPIVLSVLVTVGLCPAWGQPGGNITITGRVLDDSTGAPLPATHVFISGSMNGTTVDEDGEFRLTGVSQGAKRLYVSRLGYEARRLDLVLPPDTTLTHTFRLKPTVIEADEVMVTGERDEEWYERLQRFKRLFIGESEQAEKCRLLNPTVLQFDTAWWGKFEAQSSRPLVFENRALGYRLTYYLDEFEVRQNIVRWDGDPVFEPLTPRDSAEASRWAENRRRAFNGSIRHFFLALLQDRLDQEQFRMYRLPRARGFHRTSRRDRISTSRDRIVSPTADSLYEVNFRGALEVIYEGEPESLEYMEWADLRRAPRDVQRSKIRLNEYPIHIDQYGEVVEPYGATLYQYFAFTRRMAELLPREYRPPGTTLASSSTD